MPDNDQPVKLLEGKTSVDGSMLLEPQILSYQSAKILASKIAELVKENLSQKTNAIVLADSKFLADYASLKAAYFSLDHLIEAYGNLAKAVSELTHKHQKESISDTAPSVLSEPKIAGIGAAALAIPSVISPALAALNASIELLGFFRQDVEFHGVTTAIDALSFQIALAHELKETNKDFNILIPALQMFPSVNKESDSLEKRLSQLEANKAELWSQLYPLINSLAQEEADLEIAVSKKDEAEIEALRVKITKHRRDLQPISDNLGLIDQRYSNLLREWDGTDETGIPKIARMLRAEFIHLKNPVYLHAEVVLSGGYYKIKRNLFRTLFTGDGLHFTGGAVIRWALIMNDDVFINGGILHAEVSSNV